MDTSTIDIEKVKKILDNRVALGATVRSFIDHAGFQVLKALFYNFKEDIKNKASYTTIHEFRTDRRAIKLVEGLFIELEGMVNDAEQAASELQKVITTESATPSLLSLDGEGLGDSSDEGPGFV